MTPFRHLRSPAGARILPFALYIVVLAAMQLLREFVPGFDGRWLYAVQIGAVIAALAWHAGCYEELRKSEQIARNDLALSVGLGVLVFALWINLEQSWALIGGPLENAAGFDPRRHDGSLDWPLVIVRIFGAAVVVPVMEELFWRSFLMRWIDNADFLAAAPRRTGWRAILLSSLVFGLEHAQWFAGMLAGLAYAWLYVRSGNLWLPITAHATTNLLLGLMVVATGSWRFW